MGQKLGVKETIEALDALLELSVVMAATFKDGVQYSDIGKIINALGERSEFREKFRKALSDAERIPAEMGDLALEDMTEIVGLTFSFIPRLVDALIKKQA